MRLLPPTAALACAALVLAMPSTAVADEIRDAQWHLPWLDVPAAHEVSTGDGVTVGIVDSGVDAQHPDLVDAVQAGAALSGSIDPLADSAGSGTAIASILAGRGNGTGGAEGVSGGNGVLGIAPAAQLVSVSIGDAEIGDGAYVAEAVGALVEQGVDLILLTVSHPHNEATQSSILTAMEAEIPVVTAAGSSGGDSYSEAVSVVAVNEEGELASSPPAGDALAVAAPGQDLPAAAPGGGYTTVTGTSAAAAIVVGTMALVKAQQPDLAGQALVQHVLTQGTSEPSSDQPESYGSGVIDPVAALTAGGREVPGSSDDEGTDGAAGHVDGAADNTMLIALIAVGGLLVQVALLAYARLAGRKQPA